MSQKAIKPVYYYRNSLRGLHSNETDVSSCSQVIWTFPIAYIIACQKDGKGLGRSKVLGRIQYRIVTALDMLAQTFRG